MTFKNEFHSHDNSIQNININYNIKGNINELEKSLKEINIPQNEIDDLKLAITEDKIQSNNLDDTLLTKTKKIANKIICLAATQSINVSTAIVTNTLINSLSNYFGFQVQF